MLVPRLQSLRSLQHGRRKTLRLRQLHIGRNFCIPEPQPHPVDNIDSTPTLSTHTHAASSVPVPEKCWHVIQSRNCGFTTVSTIAIPAFTRIISDEPLVAMSQGDDLPELWEKYKSLPESSRNKYKTLHRPHQPIRNRNLIQKLMERGHSSGVGTAMAVTASIFQSNAFNVDGGVKPSPGSTGKPIKRALFANIARLNHSCAPTAHSYYNPVTNRMTVHTLRDIDAGTEIVISYFNLLLPLAQRQAKAASWGFVCHCPACDMGPGHLRHEDARSRLRAIEAQHLRLVRGQIRDREGILRTVEEVDGMADLIRNESSLMPQLPFAFEYSAVARMVAFEATKDRALLDRIMEMLKRSVAAEVAITGADSLAAERRREKVGAYERALGQMPDVKT